MPLLFEQECGGHGQPVISGGGRSDDGSKADVARPAAEPAPHRGEHADILTEPSGAHERPGVSNCRPPDHEQPHGIDDEGVELSIEGDGEILERRGRRSGSTATCRRAERQCPADKLLATAPSVSHRLALLRDPPHQETNRMTPIRKPRPALLGECSWAQGDFADSSLETQAEDTRRALLAAGTSPYLDVVVHRELVGVRALADGFDFVLGLVPNPCIDHVVGEDIAAQEEVVIRSQCLQ